MFTMFAALLRWKLETLAEFDQQAVHVDWSCQFWHGPETDEHIDTMLAYAPYMHPHAEC